MWKMVRALICGRPLPLSSPVLPCPVGTLGIGEGRGEEEDRDGGVRGGGT